MSFELPSNQFSLYQNFTRRLIPIVHKVYSNISSELHENKRSYAGVALGTAVALYGLVSNLTVFEIWGGGVIAAGIANRAIDELVHGGIITKD